MTLAPDTPAIVAVPALLSVAHVAQVLDCSPQTVRRRIAAGELRAVVDHGRVVVRGDDLRSYIDAMKAVGAKRRARPRATRGRFDFLG